MRTVCLLYLLFELRPLNSENSHLSHIFMSLLGKTNAPYLDFIFARVMALA